VAAPGVGVAHQGRFEAEAVQSCTHPVRENFVQQIANRVVPNRKHQFRMTVRFDLGAIAMAKRLFGEIV
jgi:hypothetical protein